MNEWDEIAVNLLDLMTEEECSKVRTWLDAERYLFYRWPHLRNSLGRQMYENVLDSFGETIEFRNYVPEPLAPPSRTDLNPNFGMF